MSEADVQVARLPFAERFGINRRKAGIAAAVLGGVFLVTLTVMSQRIRQRQAGSVERADSAAAASTEADPAEGTQAPWADPKEARRLAGDTASAGTARDSAAQGFVPLGRDVGPGTYGEAGRGEIGTAPAGGPTDTAPLAERDTTATPAAQRATAFRRAIVARQLRSGGGDSSVAPVGPAISEAPGDPPARAAAAPADSLPAYGRAQVEADQRAAERAAQRLGSPPPTDLAAATPSGVVVRFASGSARACRLGERVLSAGYAIPAVLLSEINSEVPGTVIARTSRDVYDPRLSCVVVPVGSLLIGRFQTGLAVGSERLVVVWEQVRLADGRIWHLPSLPVADRRGAAGLAGEVDRRTRQTLESAALLSAFGVALEYETPGGGQAGVVGPGGYPSAPSPRDRAVGAATQPLRTAADRLLERAVDARPVLHVRPGQPITVLVPQDVDLDHPATPPPGDTARAAPRVPAVGASL